MVTRMKLCNCIVMYYSISKNNPRRLQPSCPSLTHFVPLRPLHCETSEDRSPNIHRRASLVTVTELQAHFLLSTGSRPRSRHSGRYVPKQLAQHAIQWKDSPTILDPGMASNAVSYFRAASLP